MDLDSLRNQFKAKKNKESSSNKGFFKYESKKLNDNINIPEISENSDISVVFLKDEYLFFCFGNTGQKLKISLSKLGIQSNKIDDLNIVYDKIDSLEFPKTIEKNDNTGILTFCKNNIEFLSRTNFCYLFYHNKQSFHNCYKIAKNIISQNLSILAEEQVVAAGAVTLQSQNKGVFLTSFKYQNNLIKMEIGDGVIEIKDIIRTDSYLPPQIKDFIKGAILFVAIRKSWLKEYLPLLCTSFSLSLIVKGNGQNKNIINKICSITTIPTRTNVDIMLMPNQTLSIEIDGMTIASDISQYFDKILNIEIDARNIYTFIGTKGKNEVSIPLYKLMD